jgi:outer membrane protein assembly factor BamB
MTGLRDEAWSRGVPAAQVSISRRHFLGLGGITIAGMAGASCQADEPPTQTGEVVKAATPRKPFAGGEDWPKFLGPRWNGTSNETGLLTEWPAEGPPLRWARNVGEGYGAPVTSNGRLVIFHRIDDEEVVECVDALDGSNVFWTHAYPTDYVDQYGYNGGPRSSPTIEGDRVYTFGAKGVLTCVDFETGERQWQRLVKEEYGVQRGFFGAGVAPVVEENLILLNVGGRKGAGIVAFEKTTGETVWQTSNDSASYSTPIVGTIRGERLAIFHTGDGLLVVEPKTGKERYRYPFRSRIRQSAIAATPVLVDDVVFLSATYKIGAVALRLAPEGLEEVWRNEDSMQNHWATSVYHEGNLYGMDGRHERGSNFRCIEFATGKVLWTADEGLGRASFVMADGHFFAIGERGGVAVVEVNSKEYVEKGRAHVLDYPVWTPPVLSHGLLYLRNEGTVKCLDLRSDV